MAVSFEHKIQTVLIVDDEPTNVQTLAGLLKEEFRIQVATSGEKALSLAAGEHQPDLILLDILMPHMDGYEVCRRLKEEPRTSEIPVVFVTARDATSDEEKGFLLGAVDYISRPFSPAIVRARVRTHLSLKRKTDLLEQISMRDALTGIPNRRYFDGLFERERLRALREKQLLSVIMMDIDRFKDFNDNYGHGSGDEALRKVARVLGEGVDRPADVVARYGGEEFVALLPRTHAEGAEELAERFRASVEALALPHEYSSVAPVVTLSLGVATASGEEGALSGAGSDVESAVRPLSGDALLKRADSALYTAKREGRNRYRVAP